MTTKTNETKNIGHGAIILLISTVAVKIIGALFKIPLSSDYCLGDIGFGYFSVSYDFFTPIYTLSISGIPVAISKLISQMIVEKSRAEIDSDFCIFKKIISIIGIITTVVMLFVMVPYMLMTDKSSGSIYSVLAIIPSVLFCFIASVYRGYYEGFNNMLPPALSNVIEALCKLLLGFGLAYVTIKITNEPVFAAAAALLGITVGTLFSVFYLKVKFKIDFGKESKTVKNKPVFIKDNFKKIGVILLPAVMISLYVGIISLIDAFTLRPQLVGLIEKNPEFFSKTYEAFISEANGLQIEKFLPTLLYGIRSKAYTFYNIVPTLTIAVGIAAMPVLVSNFTSKNNDTFNNEMNKALKYSSMICFPAGIGFIALNGKILTLIYGNSASSELGGKMLLILGFATVFSGIAITLGYVLQSVNKNSTLLKNICIGLFIKIIFNLLLCGQKEINILGSVLSTVLSFIALFVLNLWALIKYIGKPDIKTIFIKPLFSSVICGVSAFIISDFIDTKFGICIAIFSAIVIYFLCLCAFKFFNESDILELPFGRKLEKLINNSKKY